MNRRLWLVPAVVLLAAGAIWWQQAPTAPAATWRIGTGTDIRQGRSFEALPPESPIRLSLHADAATYVYVFSHSREDGTLLLWPHASLHSDVTQPIPAGQTVLPGTHEGKELAWTTRTGVRAGTTYVVVAAADEIPELEALRSRLRHWSNSVFPDGGMLVTKPADTELVGPPLSVELPSPLLQRAVASSVGAVTPNGPLPADDVLPGVFTGCWRIVEQSP